MKQLKKLTRNQKEILTKNGKNCKEWGVESVEPDCFTVVKKDGTARICYKNNGKVKGGVELD